MKAEIHKTAAAGFGNASDSYERGRPEYPAGAVRLLIDECAITSGKTLVDVGAGTGKFTRLLVSSGARIIAVEPVEGMRRKLSVVSPEIEVLAGSAERLPLPDRSVDVVTVAQAFHWFRGEEALAEFHRVLRPGGKLGLLWNLRDESVDWMARLSEICNRYAGNTPHYRNGLWKHAFAATRLFSPLQHAEFTYKQNGSIETVLDRVASVSFLAALPAEKRAQVLEEAGALVREHPQTRNRTSFEIPYLTNVYLFRAL